MILRDATAADRLAFAEVFVDAVRAAAPSPYTAEQTAAWLAAADDADAFGGRMLAAHALVAEDARGIAGFVTREADGRIGMLYVRGDRQRQGLGTRLLGAALQQARSEHGAPGRTYAEASAFSLPVFERAGFVVVGTETVERRGIRFDRCLVERAAPVVTPPGA